jgi:hypothetical protein
MTKTTKSKKHGKMLCHGCGLYGHEIAMYPHKSWADKCEVAEQKASTKVTKKVKSDGPNACVMCKKLGHPTKNCSLYKEARKRAQVITRRCYGWNKTRHMVDRCLNNQNKHKANQGCTCYACRRKGHLSYYCPNVNIPKPNTFGYDNMLRRYINGISTSKVMCSPQTSTKAILVPKHLLTNSKGPTRVGFQSVLRMLM